MSEEEKRARLAAVAILMRQSQRHAEAIAEHVIALQLAGVRLPFPWRVAMMLDEAATRWHAWAAGQ